MRIKNDKTDLVFFLFTDHLGSTNVVSDPNGLMVSLSLYKPWGESRGGAGTALTDYGFKGQRSMEGSPSGCNISTLAGTTLSLRPLGSTR